MLSFELFCLTSPTRNLVIAKVLVYFSGHVGCSCTTFMKNVIDTYITSFYT